MKIWVVLVGQTKVSVGVFVVSPGGVDVRENETLLSRFPQLAVLDEHVSDLLMSLNMVWNDIQHLAVLVYCFLIKAIASKEVPFDNESVNLLEAFFGLRFAFALPLFRSSLRGYGHMRRLRNRFVFQRRHVGSQWGNLNILLGESQALPDLVQVFTM